MIDKEKYNEALNIIEAYQEQEMVRIESLLPKIELKLKEIFKKTPIKKFFTRVDKKSFSNEFVVDVISIIPRFDEDYSGGFDNEMEQISKEFDVEIRFEPDNYGK